MLSQCPPQLLGAAPGASRIASSVSDNVEDQPACLSCRRRKLRCTRERPACTQCVRLSCECVYDHTRQKPGLKAGAIESINRRLDALEQRLDSSQHANSIRDGSYVDPADVRGCLYHASLLLADQLRDTPGVNNIAARSIGSLSSLGSNCRHPLLPQPQEEPSSSHYRASQSNKRQRLSSPDEHRHVRDSRSGELLDQKVLDVVITKYFATIHHWIPMLHERRFRARLDDREDTKNLRILLHAIVAITLKHVNREESGMTDEQTKDHVRISTDMVMLHALEGLSVEHAQALTMLCFERMGSGEWSKAWAILGSLTRIVDYLQMTIEPDHHRARPLLPPMVLLNKPTSNAETEERKRVFWNAFLLDRLCSVTCGWTTGFTSDNVSRQLPCNGGIWRRSEESSTPYFGLWEKSQAKMGHSVAYLPTHKASPNESQILRTPSGSLDISQIGAVAYRIEATESLSQVSSFFLQQHVDFSSRKELGDWLTRFKELDLRLVHWKLFLPDRWKQANVSKDAIVRMDPNLTLAHVTHNTSMILLHQHIGYPSPALQQMIKLPSSCSAETCELAAIETSAITSKYLRHTPEMMVGAEFVFCAFVAARVLLVHSQYYKIDISSEFFTLVQNLEEMSRRWKGHNSDDASDAEEHMDLAGVYAAQLQQYHTRLQRSHHDPGVVADVLQRSGASVLMESSDPDITGTPSNTISGSRQPENTNSSIATPRSHNRAPSRVVRSEQEDSVTPMHFPREYGSVPPSRRSTIVDSSPSPAQVRPMQVVANGYGDFSSTVNYAGTYVSPDGQDNLMAMCEALLGQSFTGLDRVIPFEGTDFSSNAIGMPDFRYYNNA